LKGAIPYYRDLHIDAGTKKLILNLLSSISQVVPVVIPPGPSNLEEPGPSNLEESGHKSLDQIRNILILARQHSEELEGLFNPDELYRYTRYASDYQEIIKHLEKILDELKTSRESALKFASAMADIVEEHIRMCASEPDFPKPEEEIEGRNGSIQFNRDGINLKVV